MSSSWENLIQNLAENRILKSPRVIRAMRLVRRDLFLSEHERSYAAIDSPLPIGERQTVSAPHG